MKHFCTGLLLIFFALFVAGCGSDSQTPLEDEAGKNGNTIQDEAPPAPVSPSADISVADSTPIPRILVAYFSATGTTQSLAAQISQITGAELYEIIPEVMYNDDDLDYTDSLSRTSVEQSDPASRPDIADFSLNAEEYDIIFLGYPIWHGQAPRIISTFLESYDFSGKTIIPFCTSHSSGIGSSDTNLHDIAASAVWVQGERLSSDASLEVVQAWLDTIEVLKIEEDEMEQAKSAPTITLNSGYEMPALGLGTYALTEDVCVDSVYTAICSGYRLVDTAYMYHNEAEVGEAVRKAIDEGIVTREDMFITTKLYPSQFGDADAAIEEALEKLDLGYIDLMLLHHPGENDVEAYQAIEKYIAAGKIRSVGLSNYYIAELDDFLPQVETVPALVQNEIHPYYQESDVVPYIQEKGIVVEGWYPLGGRGHQKELLSDAALDEIAQTHGKTVAQVILRWNIQRGVIAIPGSSNPEHIAENIDIFDFELTDEEMKIISGLERNEKHDWY